jgi:hypothetical protein
MNFEPETMMQLIPEGEPPEELVPELSRVLASRLVNSPALYRAYLWASALLNAGFQSAVPVPPRFAHAAAGFVALNAPLPVGLSAPATGAGFGIHVLAGGSDGGQTIEILHMAGRSFPVVITFGQIDLHGCPPNPAGASSTCWVRNLGSYRPWKDGILTCRHAVRTLSRGSTVALIPSLHHSHPLSSTLADIDECTIDAAVLEIQPSDWPTGLTKLSVSSPSAPGQTVQFQDSTGKKQSGHILRVFNYSTYIGNLFGQRVITDCHGVAGDSGSLLTDTATSEAVGIYMGTIPDGGGGKDGIFQDLAQVESFFQLEIHY